jgi:hypothetical protein
MRHREPILVATAADLFEGVGAFRRNSARQPRDVALKPAHESERSAVPEGQVELRFYAACQNLLQLEAPFDDLIAPVIGGLLEPGEFELQKMFDYVLAE